MANFLIRFSGETRRWIAPALVLVIALAVGIATALPQIIGNLSLGPNYEPFYYAFSSELQFDEATFYAPPASYFKETKKIPYETEIYEYKDRVNIKYFLPTAIAGWSAAVINNTRASWTFIRIVFAILSFLLAYRLAREFTGNRVVALVAAVTLCTIGFGLRTFLNFVPDRVSQPILFSRMNAPLVVLPFLLLGLIGLMRINARSFRSGVALAGIAGGLLFYTFYYYQIAFFGALILLGMIYAFLKRRGEFLAIAGSFVITNILAIPWYLQYFQTLTSSPDYLTRWTATPHAPSLLDVAAFVFLAAAICLFVREKKSEERGAFLELPMAALLLSAAGVEFVIAPFSALVLQAGQFSQHIINGFGLFTVAILGGGYLARKNVRWFMPLLGITLLVFLFVRQTTAWYHTRDVSIARPEERAAETLVEQFVTTDDVLAIANPYLNSVFPARLWRFRFYAFINLSNVGNWENLERYVFTARLFGVPWDEVERQLSADPTTIASRIKTISMPSLLTFMIELPPDQREELERFYRTTDATFIRDKRITHALAFGDAEEHGLLSGSDALGLNALLVAREGKTVLYRIKAR
ncbi:MAG: hypothetical protein V1885_01150 [Candidatus Brennerbacteria bacterium]